MVVLRWSGLGKNLGRATLASDNPTFVSHIKGTESCQGRGRITVRRGHVPVKHAGHNPRKLYISGDLIAGEGWNRNRSCNILPNTPMPFKKAGLWAGEGGRKSYDVKGCNKPTNPSSKLRRSSDNTGLTWVMFPSFGFHQTIQLVCTITRMLTPSDTETGWAVEHSCTVCSWGKETRCPMAF